MSWEGPSSARAHAPRDVQAGGAEAIRAKRRGDVKGPRGPGLVACGLSCRAHVEARKPMGSRHRAPAASQGGAFTIRRFPAGYPGGRAPTLATAQALSGSCLVLVPCVCIRTPILFLVILLFAVFLVLFPVVALAGY